jgi:hypothetical protein
VAALMRVTTLESLSFRLPQCACVFHKHSLHFTSLTHAVKRSDAQLLPFSKHVSRPFRPSFSEQLLWQLGAKSCVFLKLCSQLPIPSNLPQSGKMASSVVRTSMFVTMVSTICSKYLANKH